jgi:hypothetical protein
MIARGISSTVLAAVMGHGQARSPSAGTSTCSTERCLLALGCRMVSCALHDQGGDGDVVGVSRAGFRGDLVCRPALLFS